MTILGFPAGSIGTTGTGNADPGAPTASLTTTANGSLVVGVGDDWDNAMARTVDSGQTLVHQYLAPVQDTYWVQMLNSPVPLSGTTVSIDDTAPTTDRFNMSIVEITFGQAAPPPTTYSITGTAGIGSATVVLSGTASASTIADSSGTFTFSNLANGNYSVTPSLTGYTFSPTSQTVTINGASVTGVNFTTIAQAQTYSISGTITGSSGAMVALSGASSATTTTNSSGAFSFSGLANGSYAVTPSEAGYTFAPTSLAISINGANVTGVNFTANAKAPTYSIGGTITPAAISSGVRVTLSGAGTASTTVGSDGSFNFTSLVNGTYTVTPSGTSATFSPSSQSVTINNANVTGINFTAVAVSQSACGDTLSWTDASCQRIGSLSLRGSHCRWQAKRETRIRFRTIAKRQLKCTLEGMNERQTGRKRANFVSLNEKAKSAVVAQLVRIARKARLGTTILSIYRSKPARSSGFVADAKSAPAASAAPDADLKRSSRAIQDCGETCSMRSCSNCSSIRRCG
jgi:hypothetical protein